MFLPVRVEGPMSYRPFGTIGLIAANVLFFFAFPAENAPSFWVLEFGALKPWQWITSSFAHADWLHLLGNINHVLKANLSLLYESLFGLDFVG